MSPNRPSSSIKKRRTFCFPGGIDAKGLRELRSNLGIRGSPPLRDSMSRTLLRTTPFSLAVTGFLTSAGKSSIASVSVSTSTTFDGSPPLRSAFKRRVARPSSTIRDLDRSAAPRLRESSESSVTVELYGTSSASSLVRSIGLSSFDRPEGPGLLGDSVLCSFRRLGAGVGLKTVALLLGFPPEGLLL